MTDAQRKLRRLWWKAKDVKMNGSHEVDSGELLDAVGDVLRELSRGSRPELTSDERRAIAYFTESVYEIEPEYLQENRGYLSALLARSEVVK